MQLQEATSTLWAALCRQGDMIVCELLLVLVLTLWGTTEVVVVVLLWVVCEEKDLLLPTAYSGEPSMQLLPLPLLLLVLLLLPLPHAVRERAVKPMSTLLLSLL